MPEKPLQGSFPQALQRGRQAATVRLIQWKNEKTDLTKKQGQHFSAKVQEVLNTAVLLSVSQSSLIPAITPHLASPGAWRLVSLVFALKSHFRNCLPGPRVTMNMCFSQEKGITLSSQAPWWHHLSEKPQQVMSCWFSNPEAPDGAFWGTTSTQGSLQPQPPSSTDPAGLEAVSGFSQLTLQGCLNTSWAPFPRGCDSDVNCLTFTDHLQSGLQFPKPLQQLPLFFSSTRLGYLTL